ncbi:MAG: hypothetical protein Q8T09_10000 [Candidatus Melainabacteria bacterium]|nr:hypothetical protein [Candidatus Melainabacteria bacterium]
MKISQIGSIWPTIALLATANIGPTIAHETSCSASATYKYEGNLISRKFHQPNCPYSLVMARFRKIKFDTKKQALAEGYKPCRFCLAAATRTVQAKLLKPN